VGEDALIAKDAIEGRAADMELPGRAQLVAMILVENKLQRDDESHRRV
jgi:hypothetical protein